MFSHLFLIAEEGEERMMIEPDSREDPKLKELIQVGWPYENQYLIG